MKNQQVYIGIAGTVIALDRNTGETVWESPLKGSDFVSVAAQDGDVYAATKGELFCLDPATGNIRWQNPLKGYGRGLVTIATPGGGQGVVLGEKKRQDDAAAAAAAAG